MNPGIDHRGTRKGPDSVWVGALPTGALPQAALAFWTTRGERQRISMRVRPSAVVTGTQERVRAAGPTGACFFFTAPPSFERDDAFVHVAFT